jgi:hypothetical protein
VTVVGSVKCNPIPVSPDTPFRVIRLVLSEGGIIVHDLGVDPPVGGVIVLAPDARVTISILPGLDALLAALAEMVAVMSPLKPICVTLSEVIAIINPQNLRNPK